MTRDDFANALRGLSWPEVDIGPGIAQDFRCGYCGRDLVASVEDYDCWTKDHIMPGTDFSPDNIVIACRLCNYVKRNYAPKGETRIERIADAWGFIQTGRARKVEIHRQLVECVSVYRTGLAS